MIRTCLAAAQALAFVFFSTQLNAQVEMIHNLPSESSCAKPSSCASAGDHRPERWRWIVYLPVALGVLMAFGCNDESGDAERWAGDMPRNEGNVEVLYDVASPYHAIDSFRIVFLDAFRNDSATVWIGDSVIAHDLLTTADVLAVAQERTARLPARGVPLRIQVNSDLVAHINLDAAPRIIYVELDRHRNALRVTATDSARALL